MRYRFLKIIFIYSMLIMSASASDSDNKILVDEVNITNYEEFILQIKKDLPCGTSVSDVKQYLLENGMNYGYSTVESTIKVMIKKVDSHFFIFRTDLQIRIVVSEGEGVVEIISRLVETGL